MKEAASLAIILLALAWCGIGLWVDFHTRPQRREDDAED
jgi:hypothetical protein